MALTLLYLEFLVLPGYLLLAALGQRKHRFLLSVSLSFGFLVGAVHAGSWLKWERVRLDIVASSVLLASAAFYAVTFAWRRWRAGREENSARRRPPPFLPRQMTAAFLEPVNLGAALVAIAATAYYFWAGAYTEVPSDAWRHLEHLQAVARDSEGEAMRLYPIAWYTIQAWLWKRSGNDVYGYLDDAGLLNTLLCLLAVYFFAVYVFRRLKARRRTKVVLGLATVLLFSLHQGVGIFAYIRYYLYGPTIINVVVYFTALGVFWELLERRSSIRFNALMFPVLLALAYVTHIQEAMFLAVIGATMVATNLWRKVKSPAASAAEPRAGALGDLLADTRARFLSAGLLLAMLVGAAIFLFSRYRYPLMGALAPWVMPLQEMLPYVRHLYIANPTFQVIQVVGLFGIAVYLLAFLYWRRIRENEFLAAGLLVPALTLFNPAFVDTFVRHYHPSGIYRFAYAVPFAFVAAQLAFEMTRNARGRHGAARAKPFALMALSAALLLPIQTTYLASRDSRVYTLGAVARDNDYLHWKDLFEFLNGLEKKRKIITDPVTRYLVSGLTRHRALGWKFHTSDPPLIRLKTYDESDFSNYRRWLVIVNDRDGGHSANGERGRHWPADVLKTSRYYSAPFREFIAGHPELFVELWKRDGITVYEVQGDKGNNR